MTERIQASAGGRAVLERFSLTSIERVFSHAAGVPVAQSRTSSTVRLEDSGAAFYLKRYTYPRLALHHIFRPTRAAREARSLEFLARLGIGVEVVAWGEERRGWRVYRAFLMTRALPESHSLAADVHDGRPPTRALVNALARAVAHMHQGGFFHGDLFLRNCLVGGDPHAPRIAFIDAPRGHGRARARHRAEDLAGLDLDAAPHVSPATRLRFFITYARALAGRAWGRDAAPLLAEIEHQAQRLQRRAAAKAARRGRTSVTRAAPAGR